VIPLRDNIPSSITPVVSIATIITCAIVFLWQLSLGEHGFQAVVYSLGVVPATLLRDARLPPDLYLIPPIATVFTSMFLHGGWLHLIGNMLFLWIFGDNVEDAMGHVRFLFFYLVCGAAAALAQSLPNPESTVPMIGASGAISGVLGAYLLLYPRAQVLVLIPLGLFTQLVHLPAMLVLGLWFAMQLISSLLAAPGSGGVAFGAHVGGFVVGMLLVFPFRRRGPPLYRRIRRRRT